MKNLYSLAVGILLATNLSAQNGNVVNGGFENWTDETIYDYPTLWQNSNQQEFQGNPTVTQSTDAQAGTYSCEIGVTTTAQDTIFGYVFHGGVGQNGPDAGIPYSDDFDEVRFQYKSDIPAGDTLMLLIIRFENGNSTMEAVEAAVGTNSNWTAGSANVSVNTQDSLFIGFVMGNPFGNNSPDPAAWARIDAVEMYNGGSAVTNIPDPGFEDWSSLSVENADDWYSINDLLAPQGLENAIKTIDANSGTYAIEMSTIVDPTSGDTIASFISNAPVNLFGQNPFTAAPYNATPTTFSGAFKYSPGNGDQGAIQIEFFEAGVSIGSHVEVLDNQPSWQTFTSPLTITGTPDSLIFVAYSGDNPGSVLKLDDLAFTGGDVSLSEFATMNASMYPNPASSTVMIQAEGIYDYALIDLTGKIVKSDKEVNGAIELNISDLNTGAYVLKINNNSSVETLKLIVE